MRTVLDYKSKRIYLIPESDKEASIFPSDLTFRLSCFYTYDAGENGNEFALVITERKAITERKRR